MFDYEDGDNYNIEDGIETVMNTALFAATLMFPELHRDTLKAIIMTSNLRALAQVVLEADDPNSDAELDLKKIALGILASADWMDPGDVEDIAVEMIMPSLMKDDDD